MKTITYEKLVNNDESHWYYLARYQGIGAFIRKYVTPAGAPIRILDIGCGTGGSTRFLSQFGPTTGLEPSPLALDLLRARYPDLKVIQGGVQELDAMIAERDFDLVNLLDVLSHKAVESPAEALAQINHKLKTGGWLVWCDAVFPVLRRSMDDYCDGARRFYPGQMLRLLREQGFSPGPRTHLASWGFPVALAQGMLYRLRRHLGAADAGDRLEVSELQQQGKLLSGILRTLTLAEIRCGLRGIPLPIGVSYLVFAQKDREV